MNHGRCENCWWYYQIHGNGFKVEQGRLVETVGSGVCYMHSSCAVSYLNMVKMRANSYCPDYFNRKRRKETLEQWMDKMEIPRPDIEELKRKVEALQRTVERVASKDIKLGTGSCI